LMTELLDSTIRPNLRFLLDVSCNILGADSDPVRIDPPLRSPVLIDFLNNADDINEDITYLIESGIHVFVSSSMENYVEDMDSGESTPLRISLWIWEA